VANALCAHSAGMRAAGRDRRVELGNWHPFIAGAAPPVFHGSSLKVSFTLLLLPRG